MRPSLIIHGGAGSIPVETMEPKRAGMRHALQAGWAILSRAGTALDAVEAAIVSLEDNPAFNAGVGAQLNRDGRAQLDAILMDGKSLKAGAVAAVERIRNPIRLARLIFEKSEHMLLAAAGAEKFAAENGMALCAPEELVTAAARAAWRNCLGMPETAADFSTGSGTVGAVALDAEGNLAAGTSTGGTPCKHAGRVGDSPLIGCGCYVETGAGGVSCTGHGEGIMKIVMAKTAVELLRQAGRDGGESKTMLDAMESGAMSAQGAAEAAVRHLADRTRSTGGLIVLDAEGNPGAAFNTPQMAHGYVERDGTLRIVF